MYRSHARNAFERFMKIFSPTLVLYRCHHCNWRGYMFRRFRSQSRVAFWMTLLGIALGSLVGVGIGWFLLVRFVEIVLGR
jgi:hypothetical protein